MTRAVSRLVLFPNTNLQIACWKSSFGRHNSCDLRYRGVSLPFTIGAKCKEWRPTVTQNFVFNQQSAGTIFFLMQEVKHFFVTVFSLLGRLNFFNW
jgi:hypothetical protein